MFLRFSNAERARWEERGPDVVLEFLVEAFKWGSNSQQTDKNFISSAQSFSEFQDLIFMRMSATFFYEDYATFFDHDFCYNFL